MSTAKKEEELVSKNKFVRSRKIPSHSDVKVWVRPGRDELES